MEKLFFIVTCHTRSGNISGVLGIVRAEDYYDAEKWGNAQIAPQHKKRGYHAIATFYEVVDA